MEWLIINKICKDMKIIDNMIFMNIMGSTMLFYYIIRKIEEQDKELENLKNEVKKKKQENKWS